MSISESILTHLDASNARAEGATEGPWQVVTDEHPHYLGNKHTERRIFTTWSHPQLKAPVGIVNLSTGLGAVKGGHARQMVYIKGNDAAFIAASRTELPRANEAIRVLVDAISVAPHLSDCKYKAPCWRSELEEAADTCECTCWKAEVLTRAHAILTGAQ